MLAQDFYLEDESEPFDIKELKAWSGMPEKNRSRTPPKRGNPDPDSA